MIGKEIKDKKIMQRTIRGILQNQKEWHSLTFPINLGAGTTDALRTYLKYENEHKKGNKLFDLQPSLVVGMVVRAKDNDNNDTVSGIDFVQAGEAILGTPNIFENKAFDGYDRGPDDRRRSTMPPALLRSPYFYKYLGVGVTVCGVQDVLIGAGAFDSIIPGRPVVGTLGGPVGSTGTALGEPAGQPGYVQGLTALAETADTENNAIVLGEVAKSVRIVCIQKFTADESGTRDGVARIMIGV